jgi:predicted DCC family thiol-disulfide oxidoreductase YuxK
MLDPVLFYDGECNLCHWAVRRVIRYDRKALFRFSPLQGELAREIGVAKPEEPMNTVLLYHQGMVYAKSRAVFKVMQLLGFPYSIFSVFKVLPLFVTDGLYNVVARNRHRWFGRKEACLIPEPRLMERFLP